jgi:hypothetical protein
MDHVRPTEVVLDKRLLEALLVARDKDGADVLVDAIVSYNLANTDAAGISLHVELVLMSGALERVLGCKGGSDKALAQAFTTALKPSTDLGRNTCDRIKAAAGRFPRAQTIREVWIRDLYALRGDLAHGKVAQKYPSIWTLHEHLLLASFAFPLVVKSLMVSTGACSLTESDEVAIDSFEPLLCVKELMTPLDEHGMQWPWNEVLWRVEDNLHTAKTVEMLGELMRAVNTGEDEVDAAK